MILTGYRLRSRPEVFSRKDALQKFANFTKKHWSLVSTKSLFKLLFEVPVKWHEYFIFIFILSFFASCEVALKLGIIHLVRTQNFPKN